MPYLTNRGISDTLCTVMESEYFVSRQDSTGKKSPRRTIDGQTFRTKDEGKHRRKTSHANTMTTGRWDGYIYVDTPVRRRNTCTTTKADGMGFMFLPPCDKAIRAQPQRQTGWICFYSTAEKRVTCATFTKADRMEIRVHYRATTHRPCRPRSRPARPHRRLPRARPSETAARRSFLETYPLPECVYM